MKVCINQPKGLGDIIFCQTIAQDLILQGHDVIWPVYTRFLAGLQRAYPKVQWVDYKKFRIDYTRQDKYYQDDMIVIPLRFSDIICDVPYSECMKSKYLYFHLDWERWRESAMWARTDREYRLVKSVNPLHEEYNIVNRFYKSASEGNIDITTSNGLPDIEMSVLDHYSLFDWAVLLENATEIHTVSTSIIYILEMLDLKAKEVHIYLRKPEESNHDNYSYILKRHNYILHN